jgi:RimJ/RimL family protein N-acetyltransferase
MAVIRLRRDVKVGPLLSQYADNMFQWMCDLAISENLGLRNQPSMERTIEWLRHAQQAIDMRCFAILFDGRHVGNVIIDRIDNYLGTGRVSSYVGVSDLRSGGIGTTGNYLALQRSFNDMKLNKIWATTHTRNFQSIRMHIKLGFMLEGVLRDEFLLKGEREPVMYMGLLGSDFERLSIEWV